MVENCSGFFVSSLPARFDWFNSLKGEHSFDFDLEWISDVHIQDWLLD